MRTPTSAIEDAVELAAALKGRISAVAYAILPRVPRSAFGNVSSDLSGLIAEEHRKITADAQEVLTTFKQMATQQAILGETIFEKCEPAEVPGLLGGYARLCDLTIMPMPAGSYLSHLDLHWYAETVIFDSGHPVVILPHEPRTAGPIGIDTVVVAWDHSRAAARAVADALPILQEAKDVRVLTVTNEKPLDSAPTHTNIVGYLAAHRINARHEVVDADGREIGPVLCDYAVSHSASLFVMGAYGRSRLREFLLGGATKSMLTQPPMPIFLSH